MAAKMWIYSYHFPVPVVGVLKSLMEFIPVFFHIHLLAIT